MTYCLPQAVWAAARAASPSAHDVPVSLIGLPYLMGTRAQNSMYGMAQGPIRMLEEQNAPAALRSFFKDVDVRMIDNVDEPAPPLPQGDQMAESLRRTWRLPTQSDLPGPKAACPSFRSAPVLRR
jgi:hypothetical protein